MSKRVEVAVGVPKVEFVPSGRLGFITSLEDSRYAVRHAIPIGRTDLHSAGTILWVEGLYTGNRPDRISPLLYTDGKDLPEALVSLKDLIIGYYKDLVPIDPTMTGEIARMAVFLREHIKRARAPRRMDSVAS